MAGKTKFLQPWLQLGAKKYPNSLHNRDSEESKSELQGWYSYRYT